MVKIWIVINAIVLVLAGVCGIQNHRRKRDFWRAYEARKKQADVTVEPWMRGQRS